MGTNLGIGSNFGELCMKMFPCGNLRGNADALFQEWARQIVQQGLEKIFYFVGLE